MSKAANQKRVRAVTDDSAALADARLMNIRTQGDVINGLKEKVSMQEKLIADLRAELSKATNTNEILTIELKNANARYDRFYVLYEQTARALTGLTFNPASPTALSPPLVSTPLAQIPYANAHASPSPNHLAGTALFMTNTTTKKSATSTSKPTSTSAAAATTTTTTTAAYSYSAGERQIITHLFLQYVEYYQRLVARGLLAKREATQKIIIDTHIIPVGPVVMVDGVSHVLWSKLTPCLVHQFKLDNKNNIVRGAGRAKPAGGIEHLTEVQQHMRVVLRTLHEWGAIFSYTKAFEHIQSNWNHPTFDVPNRKTVDEYLKLHATKQLVAKQNLSSEELEKRIHRFRLEFAYSVVILDVDLSLTFNIDETAMRFVPAAAKSYCLDGLDAPIQSIFEHLPLQKAHTTLLCCADFDGRVLPPQINWRGTDRLIVPGHGEEVLQYTQQNTHWSTASSIISYVLNAIVPEVVRRRQVEPTLCKKKFAVVLDCAPVHIADATRTRFYAEPTIAALGGHLIFLPAGGTAKTQPLDIAYFGGFKAKAKNFHYTKITSLLEFVPADSKKKYLCATSQIREHLVSSIASATPKKNRISNSLVAAWQYSLGCIPAMPSAKDEESIEPLARANVMAYLNRLAGEASKRVYEEAPVRERRQAEIRAAKQAHLQALIANPAAILKLPAASAEVKELLFKWGMGPEEVLRMFGAYDGHVEAAAEEGTLETRAHAANVYAGHAHADVMLEDALDEHEPPVEPELDGHEVPPSTL